MDKWSSERSSDLLKDTQQKPEQDLHIFCQHNQIGWWKKMGLEAEIDRLRYWPFLRWSWSAWSSGVQSPHRCSPPWQQADSSGDNGMSWLLCAPAPTRKAHTSLEWSTGICYHTCSAHMPATDGLTIKEPRVKHLFKVLCPVREVCICVYGEGRERDSGFLLPEALWIFLLLVWCPPCFLSRDPRGFMGNLYNKIVNIRT